MGARATWHVRPVVIDDADPFADSPQTPIDLSEGAASLNRRLVDLVQAEGELDEQGVTCKLKNRSDVCCHACPVTQAGVDSPLGVLCRIGREQERVVAQLAVIQSGQ